METNYNVTFTKDNQIEFTKDDSYKEVATLTLTLSELAYLQCVMLDDNLRTTRNKVIHNTPKPTETDSILRKVETLCSLN